jgi:hypothetical protein
MVHRSLQKSVETVGALPLAGEGTMRIRSLQTRLDKLAHATTIQRKPPLVLWIDPPGPTDPDQDEAMMIDAALAERGIPNPEDYILLVIGWQDAPAREADNSTERLDPV